MSPEKTEGIAQQAEAEERQLIDSDRLFLIGELAASIAHDFNNPLQIVLMLVHELMRDRNRPGAEHDALTTIESEIEHCRSLIANLLDFVRVQDVEMAFLSIESVIRDSVKLMQTYLQKKKIHIDVDVSPALPEINANAVQLKQVLIRLFFDAAQAMPEGGTLAVRATVGQTSPRDPGVEHAFNAENVSVAVSHSGSGVVPYEAAKSERGGTGLLICDRIIRAHGGNMKMENRPGQVVTCYFQLPVTAK